MRPFYENTEGNLEIFQKRPSHVSPHLHKSLECVYIMNGSLALGIDQELYSMEKGDFAIIFPELIHHYQAFGPTFSKAVYILAAPSLTGGYLHNIQQYRPEYPVILAKDVHPDIFHAINSLLFHPSDSECHVLYQAYVQIILARSLPVFHLIKRDMENSQDIVYQVVSYISRHFKESFTLADMAHDLGISPSSLSRFFSSTFHMNFNHYLNETRLEYACSLLRHTDQTILNICGESGFDSQRTFNRVFKAYHHISPRDYRNSHKIKTELPE